MNGFRVKCQEREVADGKMEHITRVIGRIALKKDMEI